MVAYSTCGLLSGSAVSIAGSTSFSNGCPDFFGKGQAVMHMRGDFSVSLYIPEVFDSYGFMEFLAANSMIIACNSE